MQRDELIQFTFLLGTLSLNAFLCHILSPSSYTDTVSSTKTGAYVVILMALFSVLWRGCCWWWRRPPKPESEMYYDDDEREFPVPKYKGLHLTVTTIWTHVYGLGLLVFVTVYCFLGTNLISMFCYTIGIFSLVADDILVRRREHMNRRILIACSAIASILCVMSLAMCDTHNTFSVVYSLDNGNWYTLLGSIVFPLVAPFVYHTLRNRDTVQYLNLTEHLHFAAPFAVILSAVLLVTMDTCRQTEVPKVAIYHDVSQNTGADTTDPFATPVYTEDPMLPSNSTIMSIFKNMSTMEVPETNQSLPEDYPPHTKINQSQTANQDYTLHTKINQSQTANQDYPPHTKINQSQAANQDYTLHTKINQSHPGNHSRRNTFNYSDYTHVHTQAHFENTSFIETTKQYAKGWLVVFIPITMIPSLWLQMKCVLHYKTIDFLLCFVVIAASKHFLLFQDSTSSGVSLFLAAAALISRVWAGHAGKAHEVDSVPDEDEDLRLSLVYT